VVVPDKLTDSGNRSDRQIGPHRQDRRRQIFVTTFEQVVRIRTGETDEAAV